MCLENVYVAAITTCHLYQYLTQTPRLVCVFMSLQDKLLLRLFVNLVLGLKAVLVIDLLYINLYLLD